MTREQAIQEITRRLVSYYQPERIYLIGSTARGEERAESDLDFVVVVPDGTPRTKMFGGIQQRLLDVPFAVDVVPFRRSAFQERSGWVMSLPAIALREGKLLYDAVDHPQPVRVAASLHWVRVVR
jgi:predicted nucleotidyltransferase